MKSSVYKDKIYNLIKEKGLLNGMEIVEILKADKSTVYRNLDKLVESGEIRELSLNKEYKSYEVSTDPHHHMVCKNCGKVHHFDIDKDKLKKIIPNIKDFNPEDIDITVKGRCSD